MPPARGKARTRSYDPARTRAALTAQFDHVRQAVRGLGPEQLALPTRPGGRTVGELAAHLALTVEGVCALLERPAPPAQEVALPDWPLTAALSWEPAAVDRETAPAELLDRAAERCAATVPAAPGDRLLAAPEGAMRLDDFLVTRCVELAVHTDDLAAATGLEIPRDRQAMAIATRLLADALALKAPGGSVEVRIPPFAVVQCVQGPKHTRGTPPNVVESDPLTWLRLATGRTAWEAALEDAAVSASGERADLAPYLPVLR